MNTDKALKYRNLLQEAIRLGDLGDHSQAVPLLDRARQLVTVGLKPVRPEDDPNRSAADREAWREARGA